MTTDPNKKTTRTFQCKDALWQKFEQMARELECSIDFLINDAMKQYARHRGYGAGANNAGNSASNAPTSPPSDAPHGISAPPPVPLPPPIPGPRHTPSPGIPTPLAPKPLPPLPGARVPPPLAQVPSPSLRPSQSIAASAATLRRPPPIASQRSLSPPASRAHVPPPPRRGGAGGTLTIFYNGSPFPVTKDRFIIGRGKQTSDLTIKDPNVSRQHALIEFSNGQYYIVDMGSTNGVEYNGQRVQRKIIQDGDRVRVCDHELAFSFQ